MQNAFCAGRTLNIFAVVAVAAIGAVLLAIPAVASAANTLSLSVEPAIPNKGKPFQAIATGTVEEGSGSSERSLLVYLGAGSEPCASTAGLERSRPDRYEMIHQIFLAGDFGPFEERGVYGGVDESYAFKSGVATGHYRFCGYLNDEGNLAPPEATDRLAFTVGGTCDSATNKVRKAKQNLRRAKQELRKAKQQAKRASTSTQKRKAQRKVRKAKKQVKRATKRLRAAKADRAALC